MAYFVIIIVRMVLTMQIIIMITIIRISKRISIIKILEWLFL